MRDTCTSHLDQKNLTGLAGGDREDQNLAQNGPRFKPDEKLLASVLANGKFLAQNFVKGRGAPLGTFRILFRQKIDSLRPKAHISGSLGLPPLI